MIVTLRPARPEDEPFLYDLYASTRAAELAALDWSSAQQEAFLSLQFRAQQAHYAEYPNADPQIIVEVDRAIGRLFFDNCSTRRGAQASRCGCTWKSQIRRSGFTGDWALCRSPTKGCTA
jgi:hypothetical protein